ncbi:MAG: NAD+ synthase [Candidatus Bathyarchaeia archaeon]
MIKIPKLNLQETVNEITSFIKDVVEKSKAKGVVLGLSGGVDSCVTAVLCVKALGKNGCLGVIMPTSFTPKEDVEDAEFLAQQLGIKIEKVNIDNISESFFKALKVDLEKHRIPAANIRARIRMTILYYYANIENRLVVGTSDKSERLIGYFTKYGDGGVDFMPIAHLYKTQVRELAAYLGLPDRIVNKPSSPQLYPGHKVTDELPLDYDKLDKVLVGLFELKLSPEKIEELTGIPLDKILIVVKRFNETNHKRVIPFFIGKEQQNIKI